MCEPVTIGALTIGLTEAMAGAALVSSAVGVASTRSQAKAQMSALHTQRQQQSEEINAKAGAEMGERVKQGRAERARLRVAGGEAGIAGSSFEATLLDSAFQEDMDLASLGTNAKFAQRGSETRFQSGVASVDNPSALESGLNIATATASGYSAGQSISDRIPTSDTSAKLQIPSVP